MTTQTHNNNSVNTLSNSEDTNTMNTDTQQNDIENMQQNDIEPTKAQLLTLEIREYAEQKKREKFNYHVVSDNANKRDMLPDTSAKMRSKIRRYNPQQTVINYDNEIVDNRISDDIHNVDSDHVTDSDIEHFAQLAMDSASNPDEIAKAYSKIGASQNANTLLVGSGVNDIPLYYGGLKPNQTPVITDKSQLQFEQKTASDKNAKIKAYSIAHVSKDSGLKTTPIFEQFESVETLNADTPQETTQTVIRNKETHRTLVLLPDTSDYTPQTPNEILQNSIVTKRYDKINRDMFGVLLRPTIGKYYEFSETHIVDKKRVPMDIAWVVKHSDIVYLRHGDNVDLQALDDKPQTNIRYMALSRSDINAVNEVLADIDTYQLIKNDTSNNAMFQYHCEKLQRNSKGFRVAQTAKKRLNDAKTPLVINRKGFALVELKTPEKIELSRGYIEYANRLHDMKDIALELPENMPQMTLDTDDITSIVTIEYNDIRKRAKTNRGSIEVRNKKVGVTPTIKTLITACKHFAPLAHIDNWDDIQATMQAIQKTVNANVKALKTPQAKIYQISQHFAIVYAKA